LMRAPAV